MNYGSLSQYLFIIIPFAFFMALGNTRFAKPYVHVLQQDSYKLNEYYKWVAENKKYFVWQVVAISVVIAYGAIGLFIPDGVNNSFATFLMIAGSIVYYAIAGLYYSYLTRSVFKKELVMTDRVKRLLNRFKIYSAIIWGLLSGASYFLAINSNILVFYAATMLPTLLVPRFIGHIAKVCEPIEENIKKKFYDEAKAKLNDMDDLIKIGITGSYGKTSAKFILGTILNEEYDTLTTPYSYNTPMGVVRSIREQLEPIHEIFVAEMGARQVGDIKELCELVEPKYGLISSIGPQHLETFGSLENIIKTKYELIEALPSDGVAFFPIDNEICRELYDKTTHCKKVAYCLDVVEGYETPLKITDYEVKATGSTFTLTDGKKEVLCQTILLGKHNIQNILGAATLAHELGLSLTQIQEGINKVKAVEHRLQILPTNNGLTVIDDAYNSNPAGSRAAIDVISNFEGRKIIITPGMVELGDVENEENRQFGAYMADKIDLAILVGPRHSDPIKQGLLENGFNEKNIKTVSNLKEAMQFLPRISKPGDIVLFENDLPDNYNE